MTLTYPKYDLTTLKKVTRVIKSGKVNYWTGNECKKFEKKFSIYTENKFAICVSNGSVALELALKALNLEKGSEIIVTPRSFIISASCVLNLGLKPIFADVDNNGNLSIKTIKNVYNKKIKVVILVHLNGLSCDLDPIIKFVREKKIFLIEDCSQSHGAIYKYKKVGSFGDISTWSFCQDKIISTGGEGGMITTNSKKLWLKLWSLKDHGKNYKDVFYKKHKTGFKWLHDNLGSNYRMTEIQAVIGEVQLRSLDDQIKKRNLVANLYLVGLADFYLKHDIIQKPDFKCDTCSLKYQEQKCTKCIHAYYRLNLFLNDKKVNQIKLIQRLNKNKIECNVGPCPEIYKEKIFKKLKVSPKKKLINAKLLGKRSISFPINPFKSLKKINYEINSIRKILNKYI